MADYPLGQQIVIDRTFTDEGVLVDPTTVRLRIEVPGETEVVYESGVDIELSNPSPGYYVVDGYLPPTSGVYDYRWETADPHIVAEGRFSVSRSALASEGNLPGSGPCEPWVTVEDVALCCGAEQGSDYAVFEPAVSAASSLLFALTGYGGVCQRTVRPCENRQCAGPGAGCCCEAAARIALPGFAREVLEVWIDGELLDASEYRLDQNYWLTRTRESESVAYEGWPSCQRLELPSTEEGTFEVTYLAGREVPYPGVLAARELACAIYPLTCADGDGDLGDAECLLPSGVTKITRLGVTIDLNGFTAFAVVDGVWRTGMALLDAFLNAYSPKGRRRMRAQVWSPDMPSFPKLVGS